MPRWAEPRRRRPTTWKHLPALDGLRAAAVIAVLIFHGGYLQGGFLGVDLFFALSGFLITSLLIRDATNTAAPAGIVLGTFWGRRFRRLLPAVFTMIALVALWSWLFGSGADLAGVQDDGPWAVVYLANWHFIAESSGYWAVVRPTLDVRPPVEPGDRGAVLPALADRARRDLEVVEADRRARS